MNVFAKRQNILTMKRRELLTLALLEGGERSGIEGRTRLQKLLFLIQQRLESQDMEVKNGYNFVAYDYGPFSKEIYEDVETLIDRGLVAEEAKKLDDGVIKYQYNLTEDGEEYIDNTSDRIDERQEIIKDIKNEFTDEDLQDLIDYVYSEYPEYAVNSVLY
jgi:uncharacterized protein YwgA